MSKIYFTSDLHIGHNKDFIYAQRGYQSIEDMNIDIINKWNSIVDNDDIVYICGDCAMGDDNNVEFLKRLNGSIYIIVGNHDTDRRISLYRDLPNVVDVSFGYRLKHGKWSFLLSHYPQIMLNTNDAGNYAKKVVCLHGHTHSSDKFELSRYSCYNVGLDAHNLIPVDIEEIILDIKEFKEKLDI